jgi:hypothetical protein
VEPKYHVFTIVESICVGSQVSKGCKRTLQSGSHKRSCLVLFLVSALGTVVSFGGKLSHSVDLASIRTCCHMHAAATQRRELRYEVRRGCECLER